MARVNPAKVATPSEFLKRRANVMALPSCSAFVYPVLRSSADFAESKDEFQPGWECPGLVLSRLDTNLGRLLRNIDVGDLLINYRWLYQFDEIFGF